MPAYFRATDILLPKDCDMVKWATIACDQHTSEPEYWERIRNRIQDSPSTIHMFFPEADLHLVNPDFLKKLRDNMQYYLDNGLFKPYENAYIYVERTLQNGSIRQGIIGAIDLEYYDYDPKPDTKIFATEATILQRVPPRVKLRKMAPLEFSHTVMFCDDPQHRIMESVSAIRDELPMLYDFDLMENGGHIRGYLVTGEHALNLSGAIAAYEENNVYLVGDGNHSLVTAKLVYEEKKRENPQMDWGNHPARYAMVELENIHSSAMVFESIYRISICEYPQKLIYDLQQMNVKDGAEVKWYHAGEEGIVHLPQNDGELPIESLQRFLESWTNNHGGSIDYIHGKETVRSLAQQQGVIGYLVPDMEKQMLFPYILSGKVMPKKTFSIGHAAEKRYYLEGRKIL